MRLRDDGRTITPLRRGRVVAVGGLADRELVTGCHLVAATDLAGTSWWVPAAAVWHDSQCRDDRCAEQDHATERPNAIGLATAQSADAATLAGLSDRLGSEAVIALDRGADLPALTTGPVVVDAGPDPAEVVVLDGRIGHDIPTVVVLGDDIVRWAAGRTWATALRRACGEHPEGDPGDPGELAWLVDRLAAGGLHPVQVELGNERLRAHGVTRVSVQLLAD